MNEVSTDNLIKVARYVEDMRGGEMIQCVGWTKEGLHMGDAISVYELLGICNLFTNYVLKKSEHLSYNGSAPILKFYTGGQ